MKPTLGIHWFRRDLRIAGNAAVQFNWKKNSGNVLGIFCFDSDFLSRSDFSHNRFALFLKTLEALQSEMREMGSDLLVIDALPQVAIPKLVTLLKQDQDISLFSYCRDYEPFARKRDNEVETLLKELQLETKSFRDHLLIEPLELFKQAAGDFYQVYSPFAKKWFDLYSSDAIQKRILEQNAGLKYLQKKPSERLFKLSLKTKNIFFKDSLQGFIKKNNSSVTIPIPKAGSHIAYEYAKSFQKKINAYKEQRDFPATSGTSRLSMFLKNGSITSSQIISILDLQKMNYKTEDGRTRFLKEIVWREFYYHILYHRPGVEKKSFLSKYENIQWENNESWFQRWCEGMTGFPIVDAGMRELNTTGWMHNRVRMIVASFLCKDLLIDWRWGENYFMKMLLDGDLAPNNGGWQWAASTGCDPQPYFRIFNPWLQSEKFDPEAEYIKRYVPELKNCSVKNIHAEDGDRGTQYPLPMVQHQLQKVKALALYK
ncbi:DNA photolyase family protein [bacterium]|nr:DNA photolyase family protein [bacterium]